MGPVGRFQSSNITSEGDGATRNFDDVEMQALWASLQSLPANEFGNR